MTGTVLLTIGRLPKALDLARGFSRLGWRVVVAEPFGWHLAGASRHVARSVRTPAPRDGKAAYLAAIADAARREGADLILPVSEETMHVAHLAGGPPIFAMPGERVVALHDKAGFVRAAQACGASAPETHPLGSQAARAMAAAGPVVVKPLSSCSGRGVRILERGAALPDADAARPAAVQAFVSGRELSSCTIAHDGRAAATVVYRGTVLSGTVSVAFERVAAHPAVAAWIERFVAAERWTGFISFDFIEDGAGAVHGIECNPRATSGVHFWEPEDAARAILSADAPPVRFRRPLRMQQFWSCLTEAQMMVLRRDGPARARALLGTRDVTWDWRDPLPFLTMPATSWRIISQAVRKGVPFGEVATLDVGWF